MPVAHVILEQLSRRYQRGSHDVLDGISASIDTGEFLVLVGRSGSGKSTLLNLIGGLDRPTAGTVIFEGQDIFALDETERTLLRRRRIGFVFQFFNLIPTLTVLENLLLPLQLNGMEGAAASRAARAGLKSVDLGDRGNAFPAELSGGEQQRVAVARALVHRPGLVLADEPTGNLDLETAQIVLDLLDDLCRRAGVTLVMATHSPEVIGLADRVLTVRHGELRRDPVTGPAP